MKKRLFSLLVCMCMMVTMLPTVSLAAIPDSGDCGKNGSNVKWNLDADGKLTITGSGAMADYDGPTSHPWSTEGPYGREQAINPVVIGNGVTSIGDWAFANLHHLKDVTIPSSVTSIGQRAFTYCTRLENVKIPDGVTDIGENAFASCESLSSVTIPSGVTNLETEVFAFCEKLTSVTIPNGVTSIGEGAFKYCTSLTSITIPDSVTSIGKTAFLACSELADVNIPSSVTSIGDSAFGSCKITSITIPNGVTSIGSATFHNCKSLKSVTMPDSVTSIGYQAFYACSSLTDITIPDNVTKIDGRAFEGCDSLKQLTIPASVTEIGKAAFGMEDGESGLQPIKDFTATVTAGSAAETYCKDNGIAYNVVKHTHTPVIDAAVEPTCGEAGKTEGSHCSTCGEVLEKQEDIAATGKHTWDAGEITKAATCTEKGVKTYSCVNCKATKTEDIAATGHNEVIDAAVEPTYTTEGKTEGSHCSVCGAILKAQETIAALEKPEPKPEPTPTISFTDVDANEYYAKPVQWAVEREITKGMTDTTFEPNTVCTRGQIVTFLWRANGKPEPTSTNNPFHDVAESDYYYKAVLWAVEQGITNGTDAHTFSPNMSCTRAQAVTFLWRAEGKPSGSVSNPFNDVNVNAYYGTAVLWAVEKGITNGTDAHTFSPDMTCTRGQIVTFLYRDMA